MKLKKLITTIFTLVLSYNIYGQICFSGQVVDIKTKLGMPDVSVMLLSKDGKGLYSYTTTEIDGKYSLNYKGIADSMRIAVAGINIQAVYKLVSAKQSKTVNIEVRYEALQIKEVIVKADPIKRNSDTINYYVSSYIDSIDRSIGDVIRKMPGMDVSKNGQISYNGTSIGKFYIEGMDMLGQGYGIATNNIRARDIATVQVLEFHQPIRALKKIQISNITAINLKLKDNAKGAFNATFLVGGGYKPAMWQGELITMYFSRKFQTLNTYKTNNTGEDVSEELANLYGNNLASNGIIKIHMPTTPPMDNERYLNNNIHAVSLNAITKLSKNTEFVVNGKYFHDTQKSNSASITTYYLPDISPLVIIEQTSAQLNTHNVSLDAEIKSNTEKNYIQNKIKVNGKWDNNYGTVNNVYQDLKLPKISLNNNFQYVKPLNFATLEFRSASNFYNQPSTLRVTPCIYPQIFGMPQDKEIDAKQVVNSRRFNTNNSIFFAKDVSQWIFSLYGALNISFDQMNSSLNPVENKIINTTADSMQNDIYWRNINLYIGPGISYKVRNNFQISLSPNIEYMNIYANDKIKQIKTNLNKFTINPSLNIHSSITNDIKLDARATYNENYGGLYDTYRGYIMTDYRIISSNDGKIGHYKHQNYYTDLNYGNALISVFGAIKVNYWRNNSNIMYGTKYIGSLSKIETYNINNIAHGYNIAGKFSKRFDKIATSFSITGAYSNTFRNILRETKILETQYKKINLGLNIISRIGENIRFDYNINYIRTKSIIENSDNSLLPIDAIKQDCTINVIIAKKIIIKLIGEHYFNNSVDSGNKCIFFADAKISYTTKRIEYMIEGRNLLNTKMYNSSIYNDITAYEYNYELRPLSVLFKIKFSLR